MLRRPVAPASRPAALSALAILVAAAGFPACAQAASGALYEAPAGTADSSTGSCAETGTAVFACSDLRAALTSAEENPGSTIKLEPGSYQLGEAHGFPSGKLAFLNVDTSLTIEGAGPNETTVDQTDGRDPVVVIPYNGSSTPWHIAIEGVKLTGGVAAGHEDGEVFGGEQGGGALRVNGSKPEYSSVTLFNDALIGNRAQAQSARGGAIFNKAVLNVTDTTVAENAARSENGNAYGGGIFNVGDLQVADSTVADNTVRSEGTTNEATGGGIDSGVEPNTNNSLIGIVNATVTGNVASTGNTTKSTAVLGGGVAVDSGSFSHVTLYGNVASPLNAWFSWGGNLYEIDGAGSSITSSIIADGTASEHGNCAFDYFGPYPEDKRNDLEDDTGFFPECGFSVDYHSIVGVSPQLLPLASNGGPTETLAPAPSSPVIGAGTECEGGWWIGGTGFEMAKASLAVDQRGMPRNGHCDIGAFQTQPPAATVRPTVVGTAELGKTLTCEPGSWTGEGTLDYVYEWLREGVSAGAHTSWYVLDAHDAGTKIACVVVVTGTYGSTEAASEAVKVPVRGAGAPPSGSLGGRAAPTGSPSTTGGPTGGGQSPTRAGSANAGTSGVTASDAQIARRLAGQLVPAGAKATIVELLRRGGLTMTFTALQPGAITINWYAHPQGKLRSHRPFLVATGRHTFAAAGAGQIRITLTSAGKRLLQHAGRLKLAAQGVFASSGKPGVTVTRTIALAR